MLTRWNNFGLGRWGRFGFRDVDNTFAALDSLWRDMDRRRATFERPFRLRAMPPGWPRMTLTEQEGEFLVRAELPGLKDEDLNITIQGSTLTIEGKRSVAPPEGYSAHRRERGDLEFSRSLTLSTKLDTSEVRAKLEDGVLELTLPKAPEVQPRQITVQTS